MHGPGFSCVLKLAQIILLYFKIWHIKVAWSEVQYMHSSPMDVPVKRLLPTLNFYLYIQETYIFLVCRIDTALQWRLLCKYSIHFWHHRFHQLYHLDYRCRLFRIISSQIAATIDIACIHVHYLSSLLVLFSHGWPQRM